MTKVLVVLLALLSTSCIFHKRGTDPPGLVGSGMWVCASGVGPFTATLTAQLSGESTTFTGELPHTRRVVGVGVAVVAFFTSPISGACAWQTPVGCVFDMTPPTHADCGNPASVRLDL